LSQKTAPLYLPFPFVSYRFLSSFKFKKESILSSSTSLGLDSEIKSMRDKLDLVNGEKKLLDDSIRRLKNNLDFSRSEIDKLENENLRLKEVITKMRSDKEKIEEEKGRLSEEMTTLKRENMERMRKVSELDARTRNTVDRVNQGKFQTTERIYFI
jgi:chromosome segregation ATPase